MSARNTEDIVKEIQRLEGMSDSLATRRERRKLMQELLRMVPQGPGSGLNADLLDDMHADEIIKKARILVGGGGGAAPSPDEKVKVSANDTTTRYLLQKLAAGLGITLTEQNDGADETIEITSHRKWSWVDEPSWNRAFHLPYAGQYGLTKKGSVFQPASPPAWDSVFVSQPCVIRRGDTSYLFYAGGPRKTFPDYIGIGVASFTDPEGTYTRLRNGNRIIEAPVDVVYACPSVIYDVYETDPNKKWKMWFLKATYSWNIFYTMYSYSANPDSGWSAPVWIAEMSDPAWEPYYGASFIRLGSLYYALVPKFSDKKLYCWTSKEPHQNWTNRGLVLDLGAGGTWDDTQIRYVALTSIDGVVFCIYSGLGGSPSCLRIGMACASGADLFSYTKWLLNPFIDVGAGGEFDETHVFAPALTQIEETFYFWYTAVNPTDRQIGLATIP